MGGPQEPETYIQVDGKKVPVSKEIARKAVQMMEEEFKHPRPVEVSDLEFSYVTTHVDPLVRINKIDGCCNYSIPQAKRMIEALQGFVDFAENR